MAGIFFQVKKFEVKKQALAAESDAYRQVLRWQLQNLSLHSTNLKQKVTVIASNPFLRLLPTAGTLFGSPLQRWLFRRKKSSRLRLVATAYLTWRAFGKFKPVWKFLASARNSQARVRSGDKPSRSGTNLGSPPLSHQ
jgi:hypothetical protein